MNKHDRDDLTSKIAAELSDRTRAYWQAEPVDMEHRSDLTNGAIRLLILQQYPDTNRGRLHITPATPNGVTPDDWRGEDRPSIRVNEKRTPAAIAAEITRRLLPDAEAFTRQLLTNAEQRGTDETDRAATLAAIVDALGAAGYAARGTAYYSPDGPGYGTFEPGHNGSTVRVALTITKADALTLAAILANGAAQ